MRSLKARNNIIGNINDSDESRETTQKSGNDVEDNISGILYQARNLSYKETTYKPFHGTRISNIMKSSEPINTQP